MEGHRVQGEPLPGAEHTFTENPELKAQRPEGSEPSQPSPPPPMQTLSENPLPDFHVFTENPELKAENPAQAAERPGQTLSENPLPDVDSGELPLELPIVSTEAYRLEREEGRGGLGRVYRAHDHRLRRVVAVKELLRRDATSRRRFLREVRITAKLQHPGIVPVHEAGRWPSGEHRIPRVSRHLAKMEP